jgi:hypothetical protein
LGVKTIKTIKPSIFSSDEHPWISYERGFKRGFQWVLTCFEWFWQIAG